MSSVAGCARPALLRTAVETSRTSEGPARDDRDDRDEARMKMRKCEMHNYLVQQRCLGKEMRGILQS